MQPEMYGCCEQNPSWIFVYRDNTIFTICDIHFESLSHRCFVTDVINYTTGKKYSPDVLFEDETIPLGGDL